MRFYLIFVLLFGSFAFVLAQENDSAKTKGTTITFNSDTDFVFTKAKVKEQLENLRGSKIKIEGYVSAYYAYYDVDNKGSEFVEFPTICPRNNQFSLNMAMLSFAYKTNNLRSSVIFHYGDIPQSTWPAEFNLIQEANAGFRVYKKLWFDAGFFKTHIGIESFQPRENITSSMTILSFYEPYYLSGAKLTYEANAKLTIQAALFNGYNEYIDDNKDKMASLSFMYNPTANLSFNYNFLTCDESPDNWPVSKRRYYNNFYATLKLKKILFGLEANYGVQKNSVLRDTSKTATVISGLVVAKYNITNELRVYARQEYFSDPDQILSTGKNIGNFIYGTTGGLEYRPFNNLSLSIESRMLQAENAIFKDGKNLTNTRHEFIACMDLWF